eukprot:1434171-Prymnesium_polylepis.1
MRAKNTATLSPPSVCITGLQGGGREQGTRVCYGPTGRGTRKGHASGTRNRHAHGGATRGR